MARVVIPGIPHHVTQRGNRRQKTFFRSSDYDAYLPFLREWARRSGIKVWAYCLMPNHVHLILVPEREESLARGLGEAHRRFSRMVNARMGWTGYLWQGRFASFPLDEVHLWTAVRYVLLNPVRAGLVASAADWPYSSARAHIARKSDGVVDIAGLDQPGVRWREFLKCCPTEPELALLRRHCRTGRPLGEKRFVESLERATGRILRPMRVGRKPKYSDPGRGAPVGQSLK